MRYGVVVDLSEHRMLLNVAFANYLLSPLKKIARLRTELANGPYFQNLISKYFLSNPHRLTFAMHAIDKFNADLAAEEEQRLKRIVDGLTESEKQAVHRDGLALAQLQNKKQGMYE